MALTPEQFAHGMQALSSNEDTESCHIEMDNLMAKLLIELGYEEGIKIYQKEHKWYA